MTHNYHYLFIPLAMSDICQHFCLTFRIDFLHFLQQPPITTILVANMLSHCSGSSPSSRTPGSGSTNVLVSHPAARIDLIFSHGGADITRLISEEEEDGDSSIIYILLEYIVPQSSSLLQVSSCTAGALELFLHFLILVGNISTFWTL